MVFVQGVFVIAKLGCGRVEVYVLVVVQDGVCVMCVNKAFIHLDKCGKPVCLFFGM